MATELTQPTFSDVLIQVTGLAKNFGATAALRDCSFELRRGEVHALVGENGSGKSTLVKILAGVQNPDMGTMRLFGRPTSLKGPRDAQRLGIATVFQEVLVAEARSIYENVWLGADRILKSQQSQHVKRTIATELLTELLGRTVDPNIAAEELALSDRQACSIVRALVRQPKVLILDEATSALDVATRDRLFTVVSRLAAAGTGIIFISHRMDELAALGDRITVMRSGVTVGRLSRDEWTSRELVRLMTGVDSFTDGARANVRTAERSSQTVLKVLDLKLRPESRPINVEIRAGELVGIAGLEGHGQNSFLEALRGVPLAGGGISYTGGNTDRPVTSPVVAANCGIAYVPRERRTQSIYGTMSIRENFGFPTFAKDSRLGWLFPRRTARRLNIYREQMNIVMGDSEDSIATLSGGNQQKVIIARWLAAEPKVLLLNDPTRGIDIKAKADVYELLTQLASSGVAIVMLSTEVDEHVELMDRVLVFREYELFREVARAELTRDALVSSFFGQHQEDERVASRTAG